MTDLAGLSFGELEARNQSLMEERAALAAKDAAIREEQMAVNAAMTALDSPTRLVDEQED